MNTIYFLSIVFDRITYLTWLLFAFEENIFTIKTWFHNTNNANFWIKSGKILKTFGIMIFNLACFCFLNLIEGRFDIDASYSISRWVYIAIMILFYLIVFPQLINSIMKLVKSPVQRSLTSFEFQTIEILALLLVLFNNLFFKKVVVTITNGDILPQIADAIIMVVVVLLLFLYIFCTVALFSKCILSIIRCIQKTVNNSYLNEQKLAVIQNSLENKISQNISYFALTKKLINRRSRYNRRWMNIIAYCVRFLLIVLCGLFEITVILLFRLLEKALVLFSYMGVMLFTMGCKLIQKVSNFLSATVQQGVAISILFKLSLMISLLIVVVVNEYVPLFSKETANASTAILEFIASTIIIPIVFEWLHGSSTP